MNGLFEKIVAPGVIFLAWVGSFEVRLRGKVSRNEFDHVVAQGNRLESHIWDIMKAQGIKPTVEPPEEIKNNGG